MIILQFITYLLFVIYHSITLTQFTKCLQFYSLVTLLTQYLYSFIVLFIFCFHFYKTLLGLTTNPTIHFQDHFLHCLVCLLLLWGPHFTGSYSLSYITFITLFSKYRQCQYCRKSTPSHHYYIGHRGTIQIRIFKTIPQWLSVTASRPAS